MGNLNAFRLPILINYSRKQNKSDFVESLKFTFEVSSRKMRIWALTDIQEHKWQNIVRKLL
jgi:hypothetical protein